MSIFTQVQGLRTKKNTFNLSHYNMKAFDIGQIVPVYIHDDLLPGSKERLSVTQLTRFQALLAPMQHKVDAYLHFWKIPYRLLDKDFTRFISGEMMRNGEDYNPPYFTYEALWSYRAPSWSQTWQDDITEWLGLPFSTIISNKTFSPMHMVSSGSILDFLGYPCPDLSGRLNNVKAVTNLLSGFDVKLNIRRLQAYLMLLEFRYINKNLIVADTVYSRLLELTADLLDAHGDVSDKVCKVLWLLHYISANGNGCFPHAWSKDYFTSALPFTQIGDEVTLPIGGTAPVTVSGSVDSSIKNPLLHTDEGLPGFRQQGLPLQVDGTQQTAETHDAPLVWEDIDALRTLRHIDEIKGDSTEVELVGEADLSEASAITVSELRLAVALQSLKEAYARFGTRFEEWLKGFWNVNSSDARLQEPEWLAGGKLPVNISDIESTVGTMLQTGVNLGERVYNPQGNLSGKATAASANFVGYKTFIEEPSLIIGLCFLQPKNAYGNTGIDRHLMKLDNLYDYLNPKLEHIGEQEIKNCELSYTGNGDDLDGFGYSARYAEYKWIPNKVSGQFTNYYAFWHLARLFGANRPKLNMDFAYIKSDDVKRPFAVQRVLDPDTPVENAARGGGMTQSYIDISSCLNWIYFDVTYVAPMSKFGSPMLLN